MFRELISAGVLLAICVVIHATTLTAVFRWVLRSPALTNPRFGPAVWLLVRIAWCAVLAHLVEITVWALFYWWQAVFPDFEAAGYFSIVTYTTVGYGDLVPPVHWRLLGGVEGLTGILMCGWSTAFFFAVVSRMYGVWVSMPSPASGSATR